MMMGWTLIWTCWGEQHNISVTEMFFNEMFLKKNISVTSLIAEKMLFTQTKDGIQTNDMFL